MESYQNKLELYRKRLLDTSKKNSLISFKHSDRSISQIRFIDEIPDLVCRKLEGTELFIQSIKDPNEPPSEELKPEFINALSKEKSRNQKYLNILLHEEDNKSELIQIEFEMINKIRRKFGLGPRFYKSDISINEIAENLGLKTTFDLEYGFETELITGRHNDNKLQTFHFKKELNQKLKKLYKKVDFIKKETGINSLYLVYGFLEWYEENNSNDKILSPLLAQEVEIIQKLVRNEIVYGIKAIEDSPSINPVLNLRLKEDFRLTIPEFTSEYFIENYHSKIIEVIRPKFNWKVRNFLTLSVLSFSKFLIYKDLDPELINEEKDLKLLFNFLDKNIIEDNFDEEFNPDSLLNDNKLPLIITEADSSQFESINYVVNKEKSTVIQGPPGTGKSQTITNIISSAIHKGKRVLFLSEKLAALNVVKSRLDKFGIGEFCLELHSNKVNKTEIYQALKRRYELKSRRDNSINDYENHFEKFKRIISTLNNYNDLILSTNFKLNKSLYEIIWNILLISERNNYNIINDDVIRIRNCKTITLDDLREIEKELLNYKNYCSELESMYGTITDHNWKFFKFPNEDLIYKEDIYRMITDLKNKYENLKFELPKIVFCDVNDLKLSDLNYILKILKDLRSTISEVDPLFLAILKDSNTLEKLKKLLILLEEKYQLNVNRVKTLKSGINYSLVTKLDLSTDFLIKEGLSNLKITELDILLAFVEQLPEVYESYFKLIKTEVEKIICSIKNLPVNNDSYKSLLNIIELLKCKLELEKFINLRELENLNIKDFNFIKEKSSKLEKILNFDFNQVTFRIDFLKDQRREHLKINKFLTKLNEQYSISKEKINVPLLEDIIKIKNLLNNFPESAKKFKKNVYDNDDLNRIVNFKNQCDELNKSTKILNKDLNIIFLGKLDLDEIKEVITTIKKFNLFSIFTSQYWKINDFKKIHSRSKLSMNKFKGRAENYYDIRTKEKNLFDDNSFNELIPHAERTLELDFQPYIDLAKWSVDLTSHNFKSTVSKNFSYEVTRCNYQEFTNIKDLFYLVSYENLEKITYDLNESGYSEYTNFENEMNLELKLLSDTAELFNKYNINPETKLKDFNNVVKLINKIRTYQNSYGKDIVQLKEKFNLIKKEFDLFSEIVLEKELTLKDINSFLNRYIYNYDDLREFQNTKLLSPISDLEKFDEQELNYLKNAINFFEIFQRIKKYPSIFSYLKNSEFSENIVNTFNTLDLVQHLINKMTGIFLQMEKNEVFQFDKAFNVKHDEIYINDLLVFTEWIINNIESLSIWFEYLNSLNILSLKGLNDFIKNFSFYNLEIKNIESYFELFFYLSLIKELENADLDFKNILRKNFKWDDIRKEFQELDKDHLILNRKSLIYDLISKRNSLFNIDHGLFAEDRYAYTNRNLNATQKIGDDLIFHEINKSRRHISIRDLFTRAGYEVTAYCPCLMMSPLTVAQYLPLDTLKFDLLVIDEASQLRPEYCLSAIMRSKQIVVVGDDNQLPPTSFFDRTVDDSSDIIDDEVFESEKLEDSILELSNSIFKNKKSLNWHYRSKHESLIQFSNKEFYNNSLIIFPSPKLDNQLGVKYNFLPDGEYIPNVRKNYKEAEMIAKKVIEIVNNNSNDTFGVVTMNDVQRDLIEKEIDKLIEISGNNELYEKLYNDSSEEFFVKNLENVQGDERDIIIISTVYGKDKDGKFHQRFGPINSINGHKRLNVLFTRARKQLLLYTSMKPEDIDDIGKSRGVKILKRYLEYARDGILQTSESTNKDADSEFEIAVKKFLISNGFEVESQIGVNGFFVDLGVKSFNSDRYIAGIECDGAPYHSSKCARDRDRLRQEILESLGWNIYRIWSTDWYRDYEKEKKKLLNYLKNI